MKGTSTAGWSGRLWSSRALDEAWGIDKCNVEFCKLSMSRRGHPGTLILRNASRYREAHPLHQDGTR